MEFAMEKKILTFQDVNKEFNDNERSVVHYITTTTKDRYGDIVNPMGADLSNYEKNPIVLFNHNPNWVIAKSLWRKNEKDGILAKTKFASIDFASDIYQLYKEGVMNAWSIGFIPDWQEAVDLENGYLFNKWELVEYSAVSIPANPDAITIGRSIVKSYEGIKLIEELEFKNKIEELMQENIKTLAEIENLRKTIDNIKSNTESDELKLVQESILELNSKLEQFEKFIKKDVTRKTEIVGNSDLTKLVKEAVAGAISQIKGNIN